MRKKKSIYPRPICVRNPDPKISGKTEIQELVIIARKFLRGERLLLVIPRKGKPDLLKNLYNITGIRNNRKYYQNQ